MGDKWIEAYSKWPAVNQLLFSCVVIVAVVLVLLLFGVWALHLLRGLAVVFHGWEGKSSKPCANSEDMATIRALLEEVRSRPILAVLNGRGNTPGGLVLDGLDWKEEMRRLKEEQEFQAELQSKAQEEMEQAELARNLSGPAGNIEGDGKNPRTQDGPAVHTQAGAPVARQVPDL